MTLLVLEDVHKSYGSNKVLQGISLEGSRGELIGIAGENGSGKSTLLMLMTSLMGPDSGKVALDGENIYGRGFSRKKISFVAQDSLLFDELTVADNIKFWAAAYKLPHTPKLFSGGDLKKKTSQLSGGMKRRLAIELALINSPELLIMDEPTSALDLVYQKQIMELARELTQKNVCVIFTSHYAQELWLCDKLGIISGGKITYYGAPNTFSTQESFHNKLFEAIKSAPITGGLQKH